MIKFLRDLFSPSPEQPAPAPVQPRDTVNPVSASMTLNVSPRLSRLFVMGIAAGLCGISYLLWQPQLRTLEARLGNLGWTLNSDSQPESRFSIIAIDEKSLAQVGPWPWPRETLAKLSTKLRDAGVSLQMYDIVFPEAKPGDQALIDALTSTPSVIAQVPDLLGTQPLQAGVMSDNLVGMRCQKPLPSSSNYLANHAAFNGISKGHITPILSPDGAIYQVPPLICVEGQVYPNLAISALLKGLGLNAAQAEVVAGQHWLAPVWQLRFADYPELNIPLDAQGNLRISYRRSPESYQVIPAVDVLNDQVDLSLLDNTWVQVGATAFGLGDVVPTPYSAATPGIELQARLLSSVLDNAIPVTPRSAPYLLWALALVFSAGLLWLASATQRFAIIARPSAVVLLPLAALALHIQLLQMNIWLGWLAPALYALLASSLLAILEHHRTRIERQRIYNNLNSYLPENVVQDIAFTLPSGAIEAERKNLTLFCADLRNFSAFQQALPADQAATLLHFFFVQACDIIEQYGGSVHEFKGDAVIATWPEKGAPAALAAAKALQQGTAQFLPSFSSSHASSNSSSSGELSHTQSAYELAPLALGIGIESGCTLVGSIGPAHRRTHTLLGETVTLALRIQEMTDDLAQPILLGAEAAKQLNDDKIESQGEYLLDGLLKPHTLYAPIDDEDPEQHSGDDAPRGSEDNMQQHEQKASFTLLQGGLS